MARAYANQEYPNKSFKTPALTDCVATDGLVLVVEEGDEDLVILAVARTLGAALVVDGVIVLMAIVELPTTTLPDDAEAVLLPLDEIEDAPVKTLVPLAP